MFAIIVEPLGIKYPLKSISSVVAWGVPPSTATGRHRSVSAMTART